MFAVIFLIPDEGPLGLGLPMLGIDLIVLIITVMRISEMLHHKISRLSQVGFLVRIAAPLICFVAVLIIAGSVLMGQTGGLYWFVPVVLVLVWIASLNVWDLLLELSKPSRES